MRPAEPPAYRPPFAVAPPPARADVKAVASLILGVMSLACLGVVTGLPAMILGSMARRDIDQSNGRLDGRGIAAGGIVTGLFGTGFGFVLFLWIVTGLFTPPVTEAPLANAAMPPPTAVADDAPPEPPSLPSGTRSYGTLEVVDLDLSRPLRKQLEEIVERTPRGRTIVLQTHVRTSSACSAVAASLSDLQMQRALANVTLVRVDIDEYDRELSSMKLETRTAPWFYRLDGKGVPTDAISAAAWDANVPENMAPALGRFVQLSPSARGNAAPPPDPRLIDRPVPAGPRRRQR